MSFLLLVVLAPAAAPPPAPAAETDSRAMLAPGEVSAPAPHAAETNVSPAATVSAGGEAATAEKVEEAPRVPSVEKEAPLPDAPVGVAASELETHAWRGQGFFQIHIAAMVPVAGARPARGTIASAGGGVQLGWRARPVLAAGVGLTTFLHDTGESLAVDSTGETVEVQDFGRLSLFDPFVRFFVPRRGRVEPRFDVGVLLGAYRAPFSESPDFAAGARLGAGIDVWVGPAFSLDFGVDPRILVIDGAAGVTLQAGMGATVHW
ncbi:MAG: hypothetical protein ACRBN8_17100 [Nannocystales bacterium]